MSVLDLGINVNDDNESLSVKKSPMKNLTLKTTLMLAM
jgi:hypothetical protein